MEPRTAAEHRPVKRLTVFGALKRLSDRKALAPFDDNDIRNLALGLGRGMTEFHIDDVVRLEDWAMDLLVKAACLQLVLDGVCALRMTKDDDEPEFLLNREFSQVPRGSLAERDAITGVIEP